MKHARTWIVAVLLSLLSLPAFAQWQTSNHAVPLGRGPGVVGFVGALPGTVQGCLSSTGANSDPSFGSTAASQCGPVTYVSSVPGLRSLTAGVTPYVFISGYDGSGDGGEGWVYWDATSTLPDNGCTTFRPVSAPATGRWQRNRVGTNGNIVNVKWCGAKGDGTTNDAAAVAVARSIATSIVGGVYFPASSGCYSLGSSSLQFAEVSGMKISGDAYGFGSAGSCITSSTANATLDLISFVGSGGTADIEVRDLRIVNTGTGNACRVWNVLHFELQNVTCSAAVQGAIDIEGSGNGLFNNVQGYGRPGLAIGNGAGTLTNSGPIEVHAGQFQSTGGGEPAIKLNGDLLGVNFRGTMYVADGGTAAAVITIDGPSSGVPVGAVTFTGVHGESNFNATNTGADFLIGDTHKFGSVVIDGGNSWGQGDGTNFQRDFVKIVAATNVVVKNTVTSNLGLGTGYSRSMIRLETTFPASGETYEFANNKANITGALYSDANGTLTGATGDATNQPLIMGKGKTLTFPGSTSGAAVVSAQPSAGTPSILLPTSAGTLADGASSPLVLNSTTGNLTCPTCVTSSGGGAVTGTAPISVSAAGAVSLDDAGVTFAKIQNLNALSVIGRSTNSSGVSANISATSSSSAVLRESGGVLGFGTVANAGLANSTISGVSLGGTLGTLTFGTHLTSGGSSYNGSAGVTITSDATAVNTASTIMARDGSGQVAATTFIGALAGNATSATSSTSATNATNTAITNDTTTNATMFPTWVTANTGNLPQTVTSTKLTFNPSTGVLSSTSFTGAGTGLTGTAASLTAGNVTTNANLTGPITSTGNATAIASQTGTGTKFVVDNGPTLIAPVLGAATATSINRMAITAPATSSTLAVADGKTATVNNTLTLTGTDGVTVPFGTKTSQVFLSGSGTYTTPANVKYIEVRMVGGGGGGGGSGTTGGTGGNGGNTTFSTFTASGGGGAAGSASGNGGAATGGTFNVPGSAGSGGANVSPGWGSQGGGTPFGVAVVASPNTAGGTGPTNSGAGGGGGGTNVTNPTGGGAGSGGYMEFRIASPAVSYSYGVGAAGAAGAAGTGGQAGGAGGAGVVIVNEFYQ